MTYKLRYFLVVVGCLFLPYWLMAEDRIAPPATPQMSKRIALVIGNDRYQKIQGLDNAEADARAMADALEKVGFKVMLAVNANKEQMLGAVRQFKSRLKNGDEAVFYFSGHGVQLGEGNYLLPIDIANNSVDQVRDDALSLQRVLGDLQEQKTRFALAIIDACRDNPFRTDDGHSIGGRGLTTTSPNTGQVVIYSAGTGQKALDKLGEADKDPNSLFTRVFLKEMMKPNAPLSQVLQSVRNEVIYLARGVGQEQVPALFDQAVDSFYFTRERVVAEVKPADAAIAPPVALPNVPVSAGDNFARELEDIKQRQASQEKWQAEMRAAFEQVSALNAAPALMVLAWDRFLVRYAQDNPFSSEDESLRAQAVMRKQAAENRVNASSPPVAPPVVAPPVVAPPVVAPPVVAPPVVAPPVAAPPVAAPPVVAPPIVAPPVVVPPDVTPPEVAPIVAVVPVPAPTEIPPPRALDSLRDCPTCPDMVVIPAGHFMMGSPSSENGRYANEMAHSVTIQQPFALGKYEVTFEEWDGCVLEKGCSYRPDDEGWGRGRQPVMQVSWDDAQQYVQWLSQKTGKPYRLPTDEEWEYAARAGTTTPYPWGEQPSHNFANYGTDQCCAGQISDKDAWEGTAPVGSFPPNAFGLYDMQGNVWEWIADCSDASCQKRGLRGGSWNSYPSLLRSANRNENIPSKRPTNYGFRVARTLP